MKKPHGLLRRIGGPTTMVRRLNEKGMALLTVLIFSFIFLVMTMTFFTVAGYEAGQAEVRENSTRAFYLADGAIDRAKAKLLDNGKWTAGFSKTAFDGGYYKLTVGDTLYLGATHKKFYAEGYFRRTKRDVEVIADVNPTLGGLAFYSRDNMTFSGNICLDGFAHANGTISGTNHLTCDPSFDSGYPIDPPACYTDPDSFPGATYYYVEVNKGVGAGNPPDTLFIKNRSWVTLNTYLTNPYTSPHANAMWSVNGSGTELTFNVKPTDVFDPITGPFKVLGSDSAVVVNFGGKTSYMTHATTEMEFQESGNYIITETIINTRYVGASPGTLNQRLDKNNWIGGTIRTKVKSTWQPKYCIAFLAQSIYGNAQVNIGTAAKPALSYVMNNADLSVGQWSIYGSLVSLGDLNVGGGVNLTFDPRFIKCLPKHIGANWPIGSSGVMTILRWREPAPRA